MQSAPNQGFTYDAENRLTATTQPNSPAIGYAYDGDGNRVQKTVGTAVTTYVYDANGELTAEYGAQTDVGTSYVSVDQLGSTRLLQRSSGTVAHYDYLPFGEDIPAGQFGRDSSYAAGMYPANGPDFLSFKFTGKERDWESGLDFFQARYYSPWQGRFGGVDPENAGADGTTPQTWHGYAYVTNSPLVSTDPDGMEQDPLGGNGIIFRPDDPVLDISLQLWLLQGVNAVERTTSAVGASVWHWINAPRDPGCVFSYSGGGAAIGTAIGASAGGISGGTTGFVLGSPVPVVGNLAGAAAGFAGGAATGGAVGGTLGSFAGLVVGFAACAKNASGTGSGGGHDTGGEAGDIIQTGGNTIRDSTANALNKFLQKNLPSREWGRALEAMKKFEGIGNDFHGQIARNGDVFDNGALLGNLEEFLR
jgi:RHS repeat-associated protein